MSVPRFFPRVHAAVGRHLTVDDTALVDHLALRLVGVECASPTDRGGTWICELLVNLLARFYPRVSLFGDDAGVVRMRDLAKAINPAIELVDDPTGVVAAVSTRRGGAPSMPFAGAHGWVATHGQPPPDAGWSEPNPFACGASAALAAGILFRRVVLDQSPPASMARLDLLTLDDTSHSGADLPFNDAPLDLGQIAIAGVGAVGNAALWSLGKCDFLRGTAHIVDHDAVELSNLQRYVLANDADEGMPKTELAQRALAATGLTLVPHASRLEETELPEKIDRVLVSVDNKRGRRVAQALLPRLVVNGWTSDAALGMSWHDFAEGTPCLGCMYHPTTMLPSQTEQVASALGLDPVRAMQLWIAHEAVSDSDVALIERKLQVPVGDLAGWKGKNLREFYSQVICGALAIRLGSNRPSDTVVPLAHQSALAGVLAAAELIKRSDPRLSPFLPRANAVAWNDVTKDLPKSWFARRAPDPNCFCADKDYRAVFDDTWLTPPTGEAAGFR